jgi:hypothetical protein
LVSACATLPDQKVERFTYPKEQAIVGDAKGRPYRVLGTVRSRVDYNSLNPDVDEKVLCKNYYNKSVRELVRDAKKQGADAVIDVRSVVFYDDGPSKTFPTPECSDDGGQGQILTQGIAVKWKPIPGREADIISPSDQNRFVPAPGSN